MISTEEFTGVRVLCIGDVMLDRFVSGQVRRISPESPVPVLSVSGTEVFPGGAANVARNVASLGGICTLVSVVGRDAIARELREIIERTDGLRCEFIESEDRPTSEKIRFVVNGQHMLRADVERAAAITSSTADEVLETVAGLLSRHDVVVLSDYAKGLLTDDLIRATIQLANSRGLPVIVDPKSVDLKKYAGATVITPNSKETLDATGIDPTEDDELAEQAGLSILHGTGVTAVLVTRAHHGMTLVELNERAVHIPISAREVYDVVGAGDTVIATMSLALGAKLGLADAARLANLAAGVVVGKRGTATVTQTELADELARDGRGSLRALKDKILSCREVVELAHTWRRNGLTVGFTNGCFDILHVGHLSILTFAKAHSGRLIVAVNSDASVRRLKETGRPINPELDRAMVLAALSAVDAVILFDEDTPLELIKSIGPDVLVKGADYTLENIVGAHHVLSHGGKVLTCDLVPGKSTTGIISVMRTVPAIS